MLHNVKVCYSTFQLMFTQLYHTLCIHRVICQLAKLWTVSICSVVRTVLHSYVSMVIVSYQCTGYHILPKSLSACESWLLFEGRKLNILILSSACDHKQLHQLTCLVCNLDCKELRIEDACYQGCLRVSNV